MKCMLLLYYRTERKIIYANSSLMSTKTIIFPEFGKPSEACNCIRFDPSGLSPAGRMNQVREISLKMCQLTTRVAR